jgi:menaquinone-9 beta-reductase
MTDHCDVVIVGSRLAGACAAAHFARAGRKVVALDRSRFPSDQLSTHLLFPSGVHELHRMGALEGILAKDPMRSPWLSLQAGDGVRIHERWRASGPIDYCLCVPRTIQDLELVLAARAAGADVREKHRMLDVIWRGGRACGVRYADADGVEHELHAKLVIGADGRRSSVAAAVGSFRPYRASRNGRGLVFRYGNDPMVGTEAGETIYQWRDGESLGFAFPSAPRGKILMLFMGRAEEVAHARSDPEGYWAGKLAEHPDMARRVEGVTEMTKLRSTDDTSAFFRASSGPGWALIGDAGHFKDPVIGQGQRDALWTGRAVAEAVTDKLDDPAAVDIALRRFERERDVECLASYHFGNIETRVQPVSPVLIEILRRSSRSESPDVGDLFGRARTLPQVISLPRMVSGLGAALRRADVKSWAEVSWDAMGELGIHVRVRQELLGKRFRSSRLVPGVEHPDPQPPVHRLSPHREPTDVLATSIQTVTIQKAV